MPCFRFVHYIDEFAALLGEGVSIYPADINRYFGRYLSGILEKKLAARTAVKEFASVKTWSMALITRFPEKQFELFGNAIKATDLLLKKFKSESVILSDSKPHFTWVFLGSSDEKILTALSRAMKNVEIRKDRVFEKYSDLQIKFQGIDFFPYTGKNSRGIICLKPDRGCLDILKKIHSDLVDILKIKISEFRPHVTIARIKKTGAETDCIIREISPIWESLELNLIPDHYMLVRHAGTFSDQPVFGITCRKTG